eukprot:2776746-Amphidinium_carterae.1
MLPIHPPRAVGLLRLETSAPWRGIGGLPPSAVKVCNADAKANLLSPAQTGQGVHVLQVFNMLLAQQYPKYINDLASRI